MSDPNANANPTSVADKFDGQINGQALPYRLVAMLRKSSIFSLRDGSYPQPEGENTSASMGDQVVTLSKVLTRTYVASDGKEYDLFDAVMTLLDAHLKG